MFFCFIWSRKVRSGHEYVVVSNLCYIIENTLLINISINLTNPGIHLIYWNSKSNCFWAKIAVPTRMFYRGREIHFGRWYSVTRCELIILAGQRKKNVFRVRTNSILMHKLLIIIIIHPLQRRFLILKYHDADRGWCRWNYIFCDK